MTNKTILLCALSLTACGGVQGATSGDDDGSGSDMGSGSGSDISDPPGSHPPGQIYGHVKDERGDTIDFSTGEPVHTHAGPAIDLSSGCPAVYHYAYLNTKTPPKFGRQATTNPLLFKVTTDAASLDPSASAYRVRTEDNQVLLDWTPMTADADGVYAMELHRDDNATMAALGTAVGKLYIDARFRDTAGTETVDTGCFENHPIAAPLNVSAPIPGALFGMTLAANSPISTVIMGTGAVVSSAEISQQTAEPIHIAINTPVASGTGSQTSAEMWIANGTSEPPYFGSCDDLDCGPPGYTTAHLSTSGPLVGGSLSYIVDDLTSATLCSAQQGTALVCTIPARAPTEAPHGYHLMIAHSHEAAIDHDSDVAGQAEISIGSTSYTAERLSDISHCTKTRPVHEVLKCVEYTTFAHIIAVDKAKIDFNAIPMTLSATTGAALPEAVPYLAPGALDFPAKTWDAGDKGL